MKGAAKQEEDEADPSADEHMDEKEADDEGISITRRPVQHSKIHCRWFRENGLQTKSTSFVDTGYAHIVSDTVINSAPNFRAGETLRTIVRTAQRSSSVYLA